MFRRSFSSGRVLGSARPSVPPALKHTPVRTLPATVQKTRLDPAMNRERVVPLLSTFYTASPVHNANVSALSALARKYTNLPVVSVNEKTDLAYRFVSFEEYKERCQLGTRLKAVHHKELLRLLHRLRTIEPQLMPKEVEEVLNGYRLRATTNIVEKAAKAPALDQYGRANAVGGRKTSRAHVSVVRGEGLVLVNGKSVTAYFPKDSDRRQLAYPFQIVGQEGQFNVFATVLGGGTTGQVGATVHGITRALCIFNPLWKKRLRKAGLVTRDPRMVERKKPGRVKARKMPTWVKR